MFRVVSDLQTLQGGRTISKSALLNQEGGSDRGLPTLSEP